MASDLASAKSGITARDSDDPELIATMTGAQQMQVRLAQVANSHAQAIQKAELGLFGRLFGGSANAPTAVAAILSILAVVMAVILWINHPDMRDEAKSLVAFAGTALGYVFGRGAKKS